MEMTWMIDTRKILSSIFDLQAWLNFQFKQHDMPHAGCNKISKKNSLFSSGIIWMTNIVEHVTTNVDGDKIYDHNTNMSYVKVWRAVKLYSRIIMNQLTIYRWYFAFLQSFTDTSANIRICITVFWGIIKHFRWVKSNCYIYHG